MHPGEPKHNTKEKTKKKDSADPESLPAYHCQQHVSDEQIPSGV